MFASISPYVSAKRPSPEVTQTREVEPLFLRHVARLVDQQVARRDAEHADRDVDEEDPAPAEVLGEETADERADRQRERGDARPDPDRHPALARRERGRDDRERRGVHQRGTDALDDAPGDQRLPLSASPQKRDAIVKITIPITKMRRRPSMSASFPPVSISAAKLNA